MTPLRSLAILTLLAALAGCSGSPAALGITGPGGAASSAPAPGVPLSADDAAVTTPGVPSNFGADYAPSFGPTYGTDGRYYGYN